VALTPSQRQSRPIGSSGRPVSIAQIAEAASVSRAAASAVLLGSGGNTRVGADTARRIRELADRMQYRPNLVAQQLGGRKTGLIGAVIDTHGREDANVMLREVEASASAAGYHLLVGYVHDDFDGIRELADDLIGRQVEGVIVLAHTYPDFGHKVPDLFRPMPHRVYVGRPLGDDDEPYVSINYFDSGYLATEHLIRTGRRPLAVHVSPSRYVGAQEVTDGCRAALTSYKLGDPHAPLIEAPAYLSNHRQARAILDQALEHGATGILAATDNAAAWIISELQRRGFRVPDDIAVVSATRQFLGRMVYPSITAVDQRPRGVARRAIRLLLRGLKAGQSLESAAYIQPRLVVGESCGMKKTTAPRAGG